MKPSIIFIGDTHGVRQLHVVIKNKKLKDCTIIQVGDLGLGFTSQGADLLTLQELEGYLEENNCTLYAIRGNHDDPKWWKEQFYKSERIHLVPDYSVINIEGVNILFIGGAVSIDRLYRIAEKTGWWPGEKIFYKEVSNLKNIDIVVTHNVPTFCPPLGLSSLVKEFIALEKSKGLDLKRELLEERQILDKIYEELKFNNEVKHWIHGHMHMRSVTQFQGTLFHSLGIDEVKELFL